MHTEPRRVAVIGGGIAGLAAAYELVLNGCAVELFEAEPHFGGKIKQASLGGHRFDIGAEAFSTRGGAVAALIAELGLGDDIVAPAPLGSWSVRGSQAVKFPPMSAIGLPVHALSKATLRSLGIIGAARAAIEPVLPRRFGHGAMTVAELVHIRAGRRVLDRLVRPVSLGVYSTAPEHLPISAVPGLTDAYAVHHSLLRAARTLRGQSRAAGSAVGALRGGMAPLVEALEIELRKCGAKLNRACEVTKLERRGASWSVETPQDTHEFDAVLVAVPEAAARRLLALPGSVAKAHSEKPDHQTSIGAGHLVEVIALLVHQPALDAAPRGTGALVSVEDSAGTAAPVRAKALTHVTAKWPDRAAALEAGQHVIRLSYGRTHEPLPTRSLDDSRMLALAAADAARILGAPIPRDSILDWARCTWQMTAPQGTYTFQLPPGVAIIGDWIAGTGLAATITHARATARRLTQESAR